MSKLLFLSGAEVCRILEKHGFAAVRQRGSHIIMQSRTDGTTITVPVPNHAEIRIGTLLPSFVKAVYHAKNLNHKFFDCPLCNLR